MISNPFNTCDASRFSAIRSLTFLMLITLVLSGCTKQTSLTSDESEDIPIASTNISEVASQEAEVEADQVKDGFQSLVGRWLREDGGYVLEISSVDASGRLKAAYFNPRPIHVSNAAAVEEGGSVKVGVELTDVNYPGCLYSLVFDPKLDQLLGTYYQAALQQTFEVQFVRLPRE